MKWFDLNHSSPYMLFVAELHKHKQYKLPANYDDLFVLEKLKVIRSSVPAVTHVIRAHDFKR